MKKVFFLSALMLISFFSTNVFGQKNFLKTDILGPFINNPFSIGYEHNGGKASSFLISAEGGWYMRDNTTKFGQPFWDKKITGFGVLPEWRYYLRYNSNRSKPVGIFTGVYARAIHLKYQQTFDYAFQNDNDDVSESTTAIGGGPLLGYKYKKPYSKLYFEVLGGLAWGYSHLVEYQADDFPDQYFLWRLEFSIGYAFQ